MDTCYICGGPEHKPTPEHDFWPKAEAARFFAREDARLGGSLPSMTAVETLDPREAVYS